MKLKKILIIFSSIIIPENVFAKSLINTSEILSRSNLKLFSIIGIIILILIVGYIWIDKLAFFEEDIINLEETRGDYYPGEYEKEIPYDGPFEDIYYLIKKSGCDENGDPVGNIVNSYLYRWYICGNIKIKRIDKGLDLNPHKIIIISRPQNMGPVEEKIFEIFSETSELKDNGYFQREELEKYLKKNKRYFKNIFNLFRDHSFESLKRKGYIEDYGYEKSFYMIKTTGTELRLTESGKELFKNIIKFYNYLFDYDKTHAEEDEEKSKWRDIFLFSSLYARELNFYNSIKDTEYFKENKFITKGKIDKFRKFSYDFSEIVEKATGAVEIVD